MSQDLCIIGFGEAGSTFAAGLSPAAPVRTYDILAGTAAFVERAKRYAGSKIAFAASMQEAAEGATIIISLVTAAASLDVAKAAAAFLRPGQVFLDLNSVSPATKQASATTIAGSGAGYVDGAIMAPVLPRGIRTPILLAGGAARTVAERLAALEMTVEVVSEHVGEASATKMCRSVIIKGIEALCSEAFLAARAYGVEERVLASLVDTFPGTDWRRFAGYQVGRSLVHGRRRAAEMREVAMTVREAGIEPSMAQATALRQDWSADLSDADPALKIRRDEDWLETLDLMLAAGQSKPVRRASGKA